MPEPIGTDRSSESDHADVVFHPPVLLGVFLLLGFGLRALAPLDFMVPGIGSFPGAALVGLSFAVAFWAARTMRSGGASIPTGKSTDRIITSGPYRYSRNPIYLSTIVLLGGIGIWLNSLWFIALAGIAVVLLFWGVISREEAYLERKFGPEYLEYKARVRRWI